MASERGDNRMASELKQISQFLGQVTAAFAAVVDVEIGVIDCNLEVIAGSGYFAKEVGTVYQEDCMTAKMVESPKDECIFVGDTKASPCCSGCNYADQCEVMSFLMCTIPYNNKKIGTFSLLALNETQKHKLASEQEMLLEFLNNLCNFIVITLNEKMMEAKVGNLVNQFRALVNSVHEGIVAIDAAGKIININQSARNILDLDEEMRGRHISVLFADFDPGTLTSGNNSGDRYYERELHYVVDNSVDLLLLCNITLMHEEGKVNGAVISFRKKEDLKQFAKKIVSAERKHTFEAIKGTSNEMIEIKKRMKRVANTDSTILIRGETGTGKSLFARAIHEKSYRQNKPFITVNCAAIPATLLESELFGYEEGAFTGAKKGGKPGKFELAHEGTLFLDEIGDMPLSSQSKLLQVIETKRIDRIGGVKPQEIDVRVIAATNQDLEKLIEKGGFREDLFYRLNVIPFLILPLRERKEDISLLIHHFLEIYTVQLNKPVKCFMEQTKQLLIGYPWPGNVRELENAIEYAVNIETGSEISPQSLPWKIINHRNEGDPVHSLSLDSLEKKTIVKALQKFGFTTEGKEKAASALGISRATLYRKLRYFQIEQSHYENYVS